MQKFPALQGARPGSMRVKCGAWRGRRCAKKSGGKLFLRGGLGSVANGCINKADLDAAVGGAGLRGVTGNARVGFPNARVLFFGR